MLESATLLIAAIAALVAAATYFQKGRRDRADADRSREISAREAWEKYLVMAFENPRLSRACYADEDEFEKYEWFVSRMLYAAEEVLCHVGANAEWQKVFLDHIELHRSYLEDVGDDGGNQYLGGYSPKLKAIFRHAGLNVVEPGDEDRPDR